MTNYGTSQRIPISSTPPPTNTNEPEPKSPHEKFYSNFRIYFPISIPSSSEAAGIRIMRNMCNFGLYYTLFVWIILFITLIPMRKVSLILLVIMTYVTTLYLLLLRAFPNSAVLHRIIDKRVVLAFLAIATAVQLILTDAGIHLAVTLASSVPVVLAHAVLWVSYYDNFEVEDASVSAKEELAPLTGHNQSVAALNSDAV